MGLTSALNIATSGLRASSVQSDLIARNIANSSTPGYTRKSADLITKNGGVVVNSVSREVDNLLNRLDRSNQSDLSRAQTVADGLKTYTSLLGQPDDERSPSAGIGRLYNSVVTLSGMPDSHAAQLGVIESAQQIAKQLNDLAGTANALLKEVDLNIRYDVSDVNESLERVAQINMRLMQSGAGGIEAAELQDEMDGLLDKLSGYMDIQVTTYGDGAVNIYTGSGAELVQGNRVSTVTFDAQGGTLRAGGVDITPNKAGVRGVTGGSLAGLFELKNTAVPQIREQLDEYATALIDRFASVDPSLQGGEAGLFMDRAAAGGFADATGVAARLVVNPKLDAANGGNPALLVQGLGSGPASSGSTIADGFLDMLDKPVPGDTAFGADLSLTQYASMMVAGQQQGRAAAERRVESIMVSGATIAASRQNLQGVNVDDEMQKLLVIEQSFAANAKVLTSVQSMLDSLFAAV